MKINPEQIYKTAKEFKKMHSTLTIAVNNLDTQMNSLKTSWSVINEQRFSLLYDEWRDRIGAMIEMLNDISENINEIYKEILKANKK